MLKCTQFSKERILGIISFNNFGSPGISGWDYFWVFLLTETKYVEQYMSSVIFYHMSFIITKKDQ